MRLWLLASRGELNEDPVVYAITDKRSLLLGVLVAAGRLIGHLSPNRKPVKHLPCIADKAFSHGT